MPRDRRTPIMADHDETLLTKSGSEARDVAAQFDDVVGLDRLGFVTAAVTSLIRDSDLKACGDERIDLMPPQVPALREPVQKNHERTAAFNDGAQCDGVGFDHLEATLFHLASGTV